MGKRVVVTIENGLEIYEPVCEFVRTEMGSIFLEHGKKYPFGLNVCTNNNSENYEYEKSFIEQSEPEDDFYSDFNPKLLNLDIEFYCSEFSLMANVIDFIGISCAKKISDFSSGRVIVWFSGEDAPFSVYQNSVLIKSSGATNFLCLEGTLKFFDIHQPKEGE